MKRKIKITKEVYTANAEELVDRISALVDDHPEVLTMSSAWDLLKIEEFVYQDLEPTLFQVTWALGRAQNRHKKEL